MKSAISNIWLIGLVTLFIFVFAGYLAVTISYSNAFKMKNEILTIIEKHNGMTQGQSKTIDSKVTGENVTDVSAMETINLYLYGMAYKVKGTCPKNSNWYGAKTLVQNNEPDVSYEKNNGSRYYYCFAKRKSNYGSSRSLNTYFYDVVIFYRLDLPVLGDIFTFRVEGTTNDINGSNDSLEVM